MTVQPSIEHMLTVEFEGWLANPKNVRIGRPELVAADGLRVLAMLAEAQRKAAAMEAEARKMLAEHGQSWNSIGGRRILQAAGIEVPNPHPINPEDMLEDDDWAPR